MNVAFVFAPYAHKIFAENLAVVDEDFGRFPPINLAYAAAFLEEAGHRVCLIDANALDLTVEQTIQRLKGFGPDVVGFYFTTYMFHDTLDWAVAIKAALSVPILAGGINMGLYPEESMVHGVIDYGLAGHAQHSLPALLGALERGELPRDIPGLMYSDDDGFHYTPPDTTPIDFNSFPFPARHLLENDRYYSITSQLRNFTIMTTTVGCAHRCTFCAIAPIRYRSRSAENVLDEMEECVTRYGVREIDIFDADFPFERKRAKKICEGILSRGLEFEWSCRARVDSVDARLLQWMANAGCRKIYFGIETPNEDKLLATRKEITVDRIRQTITDAKAAGINPLGFFMTGLPGETRSSVLATIRFALDLDLDYAQFSRTIAKPKTEFNKEVVEKTGEDFWSDYIRDRSVLRRMGSPWTAMSETEIEFWTRCGYYLFYYRPSYIFRALRRVRSKDELLRGMKTAGRMLWSALKRDH